MRILHVFRRFYPYVGGVETFIRDLSLALIQCGHVSDVMTLRSPARQNPSLPPMGELESIHILRIPAIGSSRYRIAPAVSRYLEDYDIIHLHGIDFFTDYLALTRSLHRKPLVVSTHGGVFHTPWMKLMKQLYFFTITRLSLGRVSCVICDSKHDYNLFRRIVSPEKLRLIPNGVDLDRFRVVKKAIEPGLLVGVGRIAANKGIDRLLNALALLSFEFNSVHLVWVGVDYEGIQDALQQQAQRLGIADRVTWAGEVDMETLYDYLSRAHLCVSASRYEAFGISTVEAMSTGTVPFAAPVGIHPDIVRDNQNGFLVDFDQPAIVAQRLQAALSLPLEQILTMGQAARREVEKFSWQSVVPNFIAVYETIYQQKNDTTR
jgi:alpha-1,3-mannosyltransferase